MSDPKKIFGQILQSIRIQKGLTQGQLGEKIGLTNKAISAWEAGTRGPDINDLFKLVEALGVSADYLLGRSDNPKVSKARKPQEG